jgi:hypothetical protein
MSKQFSLSQADFNDELVHRVTAELTHFPLCCSTGVLKNLTAQNLSSFYKENWKSKEYRSVEWEPDVWLCETFRTIWEDSMLPFKFKVMTKEMLRDYAISLMWRKTVTGTDDGGTPGYARYKAAQHVLFDRANDDKDKGFNFSYNMVYSCDHLMDDLGDMPELGEILISTPTVGAHGAKVRGAIWTPNHAAMEKYEQAAKEKYYAHWKAVAKWYERYGTKIWRVEDKREHLPDVTQCDEEEAEDMGVWKLNTMKNEAADVIIDDDIFNDINW